MHGYLEKILIIEDQKEILETLLMAFELDTDKACSLAQNGVEAISLLNQEKIDLIITDLNMPEMDGFEFCKKVYESGYDIPIIIVSGEKPSDRFFDLLNMGIVSFIQKPFSIDQLVETVNFHIEKEFQDHFEKIYIDKTLAKAKIRYSELTRKEQIKILVDLIE